MIEERASRVIDAPVDEVFAFMADLERVPEWVAGVREVRVVSGDAQTVGGRVAHVNEYMGRTFESSFEVLEWVPNEIMVFQVLSGPLRGESREALKALGPRSTRVEISVTGDAAGPFRFMRGMTARVAHLQLETSLDNLKRLIEEPSRNDSRTPTR
ncbi:MAG: SRPBCC family protein [Actinomycetota bacterium]|nr:SRPBCC family protein [Actinomycetota bacterium]